MKRCRISTPVSIKFLYVACTCLIAGGIAQVSLNYKKETPIMLDGIHFYVSDRQAANQFFIRNFFAKSMAQAIDNPIRFMDFLEIRPGQSSISISTKGPFSGIGLSDAKKWNRELVAASLNAPPVFGIQWLALRTRSVKNAMEQLEANGVKIISRAIKIPGEANADAFAVAGPDHSKIIIVERKGERSKDTYYGIDHILFMVQDIEANQKFFTEVYGGEIIDKASHYCKIKVGNHDILLANPEALGINKEEVLLYTSVKQRMGVGHLTFLYDNPQMAYQEASLKGYSFSLRPTRMLYFNKPTIYTFAVTNTPDGIPCEMYAEEGRQGPRKEYLQQESLGIPAGNKQ